MPRWSAPLLDSYPAICNHARRMSFLVSSSEKACALRGVIIGLPILEPALRGCSYEVRQQVEYGRLH